MKEEPKSKIMIRGEVDVYRERDRFTQICVITAIGYVCTMKYFLDKL